MNRYNELGRIVYKPRQSNDNIPVSSVDTFNQADESDDEFDTTIVENTAFTTVEKSKSPKKAANQWPPLPNKKRQRYVTRTQEISLPPATTNIIPIVNVTTSNRFGVLAGKAKHAHSVQPKTAITAKAMKPPPLIVPGMTSISVRASLTAAGIDSADETKNTQEGVKVFASTKDGYLAIAQHQKHEQRNYYSHPFRDEKMTKFVVTGLCRANYTEIVPELNAVGFFPSKITEINLENKRWEDDGTFIVYFTNSNPATLVWLHQEPKHYATPE